MRRFFITILHLTALLGSSHALALPSAYLGSWQGRCHLAGTTKQSFNMSLLVKPQEPGRFQWKVTYQSATLHQVRDYTLLVDKNHPQKFIIDENNGLLLDGFLSGLKMTQLFSLESGAIIFVQNEIRGRSMFITMPSWTAKSPRSTTTTDGSTTVQSFRATGLQECRLERHELNSR